MEPLPTEYIKFEESVIYQPEFGGDYALNFSLVPFILTPDIDRVLSASVDDRLGGLVRTSFQIDNLDFNCSFEELANRTFDLPSDFGDSTIYLTANHNPYYIDQIKFGSWNGDTIPVYIEGIVEWLDDEDLQQQVIIDTFVTRQDRTSPSKPAAIGEQELLNELDIILRPAHQSQIAQVQKELQRPFHQSILHYLGMCNGGDVQAIVPYHPKLGVVTRFLSTEYYEMFAALEGEAEEIPQNLIPFARTSTENTLFLDNNGNVLYKLFHAERYTVIGSWHTFLKQLLVLTTIYEPWASARRFSGEHQNHELQELLAVQICWSQFNNPQDSLAELIALQKAQPNKNIQRLIDFINNSPSERLLEWPEDLHLQLEQYVLAIRPLKTLEETCQSRYW